MQNEPGRGTRRRSMLAAAGALLGSAGAAAAAQGPATDDFEAITQALVDALAPGRADVWTKWIHPDFVQTDENGARLDRAQFLAGFQPLPPGAGGQIRVVDFIVRRAGETVVATYALDEAEQFHGETLHAKYRATDTWVSTQAGWRLLASQVIALRTDPPSVELPPAAWRDYVGSYRLPDGLTLQVEYDGARAAMRKGGGALHPLNAELHDLLFIPGDPRIRYLASRGADGRVTRLIERRESWDLVWDRSP